MKMIGFRKFINEYIKSFIQYGEFFAQTYYYRKSIEDEISNDVKKNE